MSREWKPGDVVSTAYGVGLVVPFNRIGCNSAHANYPIHVHLADGDWSSLAAVRPLVVIDPEDREAVERLARALPLHWNLEQPDDPDLFTESVNEIAAALREYANPNPTRPDEPQGLGAVVEDEDGALWLRTTSPENDRDHLDKPWLSGVVRGHWQAVAAVRVLSPGVEVSA